MESPILNTNPPQSSLGESGNSEVLTAFAVLSPVVFSTLSHHILHKALLAGLKREGIPDVQLCGHFKDVFSSGLIISSKAQQGLIIESLKGTLAELELLPVSLIAVHTADAAWLTIHGYCEGSIDFEKTFLRAEDMKACAAEIDRQVSYLKGIVQALQRMQPKEKTEP